MDNILVKFKIEDSIRDNIVKPYIEGGPPSPNWSKNFIGFINAEKFEKYVSDFYLIKHCDFGYGLKGKLLTCKECNMRIGQLFGRSSDVPFDMYNTLYLDADHRRFYKSEYKNDTYLSIKITEYQELYTKEVKKLINHFKEFLIVKDEHKDMLSNDFLGIMTLSIQQTGSFTLERFALSAVSLLNVYVNSNVIPQCDKVEYAKFLCKQYNMGCNNQLDVDFINNLSSKIAEDTQIDFVLLKGIK